MVAVAFYRGTHRLFDRVVQWWTRGDFSHCELVISSYASGTHLCASSSMMDGGVRIKAIQLTSDKWVIVPVNGVCEEQIQRWMRRHVGQKYDYAGLLGFFWRPQSGKQTRWFCSEAVADMIGLKDSWRYCPNTLYSALSSSKGMK